MFCITILSLSRPLFLYDTFYAVLRVLTILIHSGDHYGEATPVPIPNTAVKLSCADDTTLVTA